MLATKKKNKCMLCVVVQRKPSLEVSYDNVINCKKM